MFERFTAKAQRVIFFARYEASQFGSSQIESEHLLLGLLQEDDALAQVILPDSESRGGIRREIETAVELRKRVSLSVEMPLSQESKRILARAAEESQLSQRFVHPGHILLGILREEKCLGARVLAKKDVRLPEVREKVTNHIMRDEAGRDERAAGASRWGGSQGQIRSSSQAKLGPAVNEFLESWAKRDPKKLAALFAAHGQFWDVGSELWLTPAQVEKGLAAHFAASEPQELAPDIKDVKFVTTEVSVATLIWEPQGEAKKRNAAALRMVLVYCNAHPGWLVVSAHLALLQPGSSKRRHG
jgi:uncharacterized protein (TIGR02246 family)